MGLKIWSKGTERLHYSAIISLILIILGFTGVLRYGKKIHQNFVILLACSLLFGSLIFQPIFIFTYEVAKSNSEGLSALEYFRDDSYFMFKSNESNTNLLFDGQIKLKNFSDKRKEFYIKVLPNKNFLEYVKDKEIIVSDEFNQPIKYTVDPKSIVYLNAKFSANQGDDLHNLGGNVSQFDIILFNNNEEENFIKDSY